MEGPVKYMLMICRDEGAWEKLGVSERQHEALAIAARVPLARTSAAEVRPVREGQPS